jgi:RNA polymerase sigma factor (sigma-70 family)
MKKDWYPEKEDFDRLLKWLDPDPEKAAQIYEKIRKNMIKLFSKRGCHLSEDLADEAFNSVMRRLRNAPDGIPGSQAAYLTAVAKNLYLKYIAKAGVEDPIDPNHPRYSSGSSNHPDGFSDRAFECLEKCLSKLEPENRSLILDYYREEKRAKIDGRAKIAEKYGLTLNALRIRTHRIRDRLHQWLDECLK